MPILPFYLFPFTSDFIGGSPINGDLLGEFGHETEHPNYFIGLRSKGSNGSFSDSEINLSKSVKNVLS